MPRQPELSWVPSYFDVALSGGGHRATLFTLGALLYIADAQANSRVRAVSSVSGGSITNGFVAQECDFKTIDPEAFEKVAGTLSRLVVRRGLLRATWLSRAYFAFLAISAAFLASTAFFAWPVTSGGGLLATAILCWFTLFFLRGKVVESLFGSVLFANRQEKRPTELRDLGRHCVHVFCATDLVLGRPFYFVALQRGYLFGFGSPAKTSVRDDTGEWKAAENIRLQTAVRASAAFPGGFPPKLLRLSPTQQGAHPWRKVAFLADGGVWNNLATQWWDDGPRFRFPPGFERREPANDWASPDPNILVVDASAPPQPVGRSWPFAIPLLGEVLALARTMSVLYTNTLEPRLIRLAQSVAGTGWGSRKAVISLTDKVGQMSSAVGEAIGWRLQTSDAAHEDPDKVMSLWYELKALESRCTAWKEYQVRLQNKLDTEQLRSECMRVPTTLSKVSATQAIALLAYGYLLTMEAMFIGFATTLVDFPGMERFRKLLND